MRIYTPLPEPQKNRLSQLAHERVQKKYPVGTCLRKLTVLDHVRMVCAGAKTARSYWAVKCRCACGEVVIVRPSTLTGKGRSESCGCEGVRKRTEASKRVWMLPAGQAALNAAYSKERAYAVGRGIRWELSLEQFKHVTQQPCTYCGAPPSKVYGSTAAGKPRLNGDYVYNGIDRQDSLVGYSASNCVSCCKHCNYAKRNMSLDEFSTWLRRAASYFLGMT